MRRLVHLLFLFALGAVACVQAQEVTVSENSACPTAPEQVRAAAVYPQEALECGLAGRLEVEVRIDKNGAMKGAVVIYSMHRAFNRPTMQAIRQLKCEATDSDVTTRLTFLYSPRVTRNQDEAHKCYQKAIQQGEQR